MIPSPPKQYPHSPTHTYLILNGSIPHTQTFVRFYLLIEYPSRFGCVGFGGKRDHRLEENCEQKEPGRGERQPHKRQTRRTGTFPNRKWGGQRNSSIELLRIIAMFMILMYHFITQNGFPINKLPLAMEIFFRFFMASGGKVGVVIFFSISAWFFLDKEQTIKSNLKRVWIMERELLFWSLTLMAFYLMLDRACIDAKLMIKSIVPLSMSLWWYATAYAIFLALLPFLSKGLKALGRKYHLALAITVLIIWGLTSFIPGSLGGYPSINSSLTGVFGFIYLFIIISAYKWYMKPFTLKKIGVLLGTGIGLSLLFEIVSIVLHHFGFASSFVITSDWKLPMVMIGFGIFLLFNKCTFHSQVINRIAQSAFAVYLITVYDASITLLWKRLFNLGNLYQRPFAILQILGILLAIYMVCTLLDFVRQVLFTITIDRRRGRWFELLWDMVYKQICNHSHTPIADSSSIQAQNC